MKKINSKNFEEAKIENPLKLLGKKTIHFTVEKYPHCKKESSSLKIQEENFNEGRWSYIEQVKFIKALSKVGPDWKKINETIKFRTLSQIRSHAQKFFQRLKRCKNKELGIDFTSNSIKSFKDMINHIKLVNSNYDINNVFLYLSDINQRNLDEVLQKSKEDELPNLISTIVGNNYDEIINISNDFFNENKINIPNISNEIIDQSNNKSDLENLNNIQLIDSLNNMNNNLNVFILNYLNKIKKTNNFINNLYNIYLANINKTLSNVVQSSMINTLNFINNSNINANENNINNL